MIFRRLYTTLYNRSASTVRACSSLARFPLSFAPGNKSVTNDCGLALTNIFIALSQGFAKSSSPLLPSIVSLLYHSSFHESNYNLFIYSNLLLQFREVTNSLLPPRHSGLLLTKQQGRPRLLDEGLLLDQP